MSRDIFHQPRLLRAPSNLALNPAREGAATASLGNLLLWSRKPSWPLFAGSRPLCGHSIQALIAVGSGSVQNWVVPKIAYLPPFPWDRAVLPGTRLHASLGSRGVFTSGEGDWKIHASLGSRGGFTSGEGGWKIG